MMQNRPHAGKLVGGRKQHLKRFTGSFEFVERETIEKGVHIIAC